MVFLCSDCGCEFQLGVRRSTCISPTCCCSTDSAGSIESLAARIIAAIESGDRVAMRELLSPNASWGASGQKPATCSTREQIMQWYENQYAQGIRVTIDETLVVDHHIIFGLKITQLRGDVNGVRGHWQVLAVEHALIVEIRGYESRDGALLAAMSGADRD